MKKIIESAFLLRLNMYIKNRLVKTESFQVCFCHLEENLKKKKQIHRNKSFLQDPHESNKP